MVLVKIGQTQKSIFFIGGRFTLMKMEHTVNRVKIRIDLDEESQAIIQEDGKLPSHSIETTAECHMYIPDTFSDGSGHGGELIWWFMLTTVMHDERNRDDGDKKNIRNLEKSSWNLMESMDFSAFRCI